MKDYEVSIRVGEEVEFVEMCSGDDMIESTVVPFKKESKLSCLDRHTGRKDIDSWHSSRKNDYKLKVGEIGIVTYIYIDKYNKPRLHVQVKDGKEIDCNLDRIQRMKKEELWECYE